MKKAYIKAYVTKTGDNSYRAIASSDSIDRYGDIVDQAGIDTANYMRNPVMLWAHDSSQLPVAKVTGIDQSQTGKTIVDFEFADATMSPLAPYVKNSYDAGFLNALSIGFMANERKSNTITQSELLEISFVPVPANQDALRLGMTKGMDLGPAANDIEVAIEKAISKKGDVADEVEVEEQNEQKWNNWCLIGDVLSALWTVYFDEETDVDDFPELLTEAIALFQEIAENYDGDDEEVQTAAFKKHLKKFLGGRTVTKTVTVEKSGKVLSAKSQALVEKAMSHMKEIADGIKTMTTSHENGIGALEDLMASTSTDEGADDADPNDEDPLEENGLSAADLTAIRTSLNLVTHQASFATSIVKDAIAKLK